MLYHNSELRKSRYYSGAYEKEITQAGIKEYHYIAGIDGIAAVNIKTGDNDTTYYLVKDHLGSIIKIIRTDQSLVKEYSYDPWGNPRNPANWSLNNVDTDFFVNMGYTGHEHLPEFGLVNMNGRMYDPVIGRVLSPDNYVQSPENAQNYNRYSYCLNNPLKYTDPSGDWFGIDDAIAAIVGGVVNLGTNIFNGNLSGMSFGETLGKAAAAFGAGAAAGTLSLYGPGGWVAGGAIVGGTNAWLGGATSFEDIAVGAGVGAVSGLLGGAAGQWAGKGLGGVVINGFKINSPVLQGTITGVIGGGVGGYVGGFAGGFLMSGGNMEIAKQSGLAGLKMGAGIGAISGFSGSYAAAKDAGINPWTGRADRSVTIGEGMIERVTPRAKDLGSETIGKDWPDHIKSYQHGKPTTEGMQFNKQWIEIKIQNDYYIYDVGPRGNQTVSPYYNMELNTIINYPKTYNVYHIQYTQTIRILIIYK